MLGHVLHRQAVDLVCCCLHLASCCGSLQVDGRLVCSEQVVDVYLGLPLGYPAGVVGSGCLLLVFV